MLTFPMWFEIFLGWFLLAIILGIVNYSMKDMYVYKIAQLPSERKIRIRNASLRIIKIYKIFFYASPIYLVALPLLLYKYNKQDFFHVTVLEFLIYILILMDFFIGNS